ncbi:MAG: tRNA pseudouridine(38-40) synthase TruA [Deltaproteobacteria bacterium]|nr:tRNA pseudouridine(38-40) synthase TruA [Deltaproteobacteria bacterium]
MRYALLVEYHGKFFSGWQIQPSRRTVQGEIERALRIILKKETKVSAAGRTDAGVHATGQVASFESETEIQPRNLLLSLNGVLPKDISVISVAHVDERFHPRFSAKTKIYEYRLLTRHGRASVFADTIYHYHFPLNFENITSGIAFLNHLKDFSAFRAADNECRGDVREIEISFTEPEPSFYVFTFKGRAFYKNMIRIIIGTLLRLGRGDIDIEGLKKIAESGDRREAFETAPACGLILRKVIYEPDIKWEI